MITTVFAHFDGKQSLVLEEPVELPVGARLRLHVEPVEGEAEQPTTTPPSTVTRAPRRFQPLDIKVDPELSHAIALDPEFDIEES